MASIQEKVDTVANRQPQAVSKAADDEAKKARGERLAIFVGLWPPTLAIFGKVIEDRARHGKSVQ